MCARRIAALVVVLAAMSLRVMADAPESTSANVANYNVNSAYLVERVDVQGLQNRFAPSAPLKSDLDGVVGRPLDNPKLAGIANKLRRELRAPSVAVQVQRGTSPGMVAVSFVVEPAKKDRVDLALAHFLYDSRIGWSGEGAAAVQAAGNTIRFGLIADGDRQVERLAGVETSIERSNVGTERLGLRLDFDAYHEQWNSATLAQSSASEIYRTRHVLSPMATVNLLRGLKLDFGVRFTRFRLSTPGARADSSNAVVSTLRYHRRWGADRDVAASYSASFSGNYARQELSATMTERIGADRLELRSQLGMAGLATPLYDRFVLGNSAMLRGWDKFELDPRGGTRIAAASTTFVHKRLIAFYDTGAISDPSSRSGLKHSLGVGFRDGNFEAAIGFPVREGRVTPIAYAGVNF